ncbi:hypothetical protein M2135_002339 [Parabacteroides sp. PF5-9]|nr:hypothetical protein [Parabacteroides sp. PF5-9]
MPFTKYDPPKKYIYEIKNFNLLLVMLRIL